MKIDNIEICDVIWFDTFGIIKGKDVITNEIKIYMGQGYGFSEKDDIQKIVSLGIKHNPDEFIKLIKRFGLIE